MMGDISNNIMHSLAHDTIIKRLKNEIRDKLIDNMHLDDVNIDNVIKYLNNCSLQQMLELYQINEILDDWQLIGRVIGVVIDG